MHSSSFVDRMGSMFSPRPTPMASGPAFVWEPLPRDAPPPPEDGVVVFEHTFPCSARHLFGRSILPYDDLQRLLGAENLELGSWTSHPTLGFVRDFSFKSRIRSKIMVGYSHTQCFQSQRYQVYTSAEGFQHLVFETSQVMRDIPYGDIFKVECRWDVEDIPGEAAASAAQQLGRPPVASPMSAK